MIELKTSITSRFSQFFPDNRAKSEINCRGLFFYDMHSFFLPITWEKTPVKYLLGFQQHLVASKIVTATILAHCLLYSVNKFLSILIKASISSLKHIFVSIFTPLSFFHLSSSYSFFHQYFYPLNRDAFFEDAIFEDSVARLVVSSIKLVADLKGTLMQIWKSPYMF